MVNSVCLDASIIIKFLTKEKDSDLAHNLIKSLINNDLEIIEPHFLKIEVYSTLRKKSHLKDINNKSALKALNFLNEMPITYLVGDKNILDKAIKISTKLKETVIYDCIYLTLAKEEKSHFITADKRFYQKAKKVYKSSHLLGEFVKH